VRDLKPEQVGSFLYKVAEGNEIRKAQEFQHDGYLRIGYIDKPNPTRFIEDPYQKYSAYIIALKSENGVIGNGELVGVIRQIHHSSLGFPVINDFKLYPEAKARLESIDPQTIVELGGLYTEPGCNVAKDLYSYAWQRSKLLGHRHWLAAIDLRLFKIFRKRLLFQFNQIGYEKFYLGSITVPAMMDCVFQKQYMWGKAPHLATLYDKPLQLEETFNLLQDQISLMIFTCDAE